VLEGKHVTPFAVNAAGATHRIVPAVARQLLPHAPFARARLAYRDVSGVSNRTSLVAAIVPANAVTTHTLFCLRTPLPLELQQFLCGVFNSYVLNAVVRMLMGGHVTTSLIEDLPVPAWRGSALQRKIARLAASLARSPDDTARRANLQGAVARLYGLDSAQFADVLEGFPLVFADVLDGFPLVPAAERAAAFAALEHRRPAGIYSGP
jgi:hypothetical protein